MQAGYRRDPTPRGNKHETQREEKRRRQSKTKERRHKHDNTRSQTREQKTEKERETIRTPGALNTTSKDHAGKDAHRTRRRDTNKKMSECRANLEVLFIEVNGETPCPRRNRNTKRSKETKTERNKQNKRRHKHNNTHTQTREQKDGEREEDHQNPGMKCKRLWAKCANLFKHVRLENSLR